MTRRPTDCTRGKRYRPIASGALPQSIAIGLVPALFAGAMAACLPLGPRVVALLVGYVALMVAYSLTLKSIVLLDVLVLAAGFALRVIVGAAAVDILPSAQLLEFCVLLFFSLALVKRYAELALGVPEPKTFSTKDFRPRGSSILDWDPRLNLEDDALVRDTSVWQKLSDYRTHDRIGVLTLFESHASELSLQAGKRGAPSLQWTSRLSNWRHGSRGLLDGLFPGPAIGESNGAHGAPHSASASSAGKAAAAIAPLHYGPPIPP